MRIAIVCPYSLDVPGGVQGQVLGGARAFAASGHDVVVIAPGTNVGDPGVFSVRLLGRTVSVPANGSMAPVAFTPTAVVALRRHLFEFRPDVVVVHEPLVPLVSIAAVVVSTAPCIGVFHRGGVTPLLRALRPLGTAVGRRLAGGAVVSDAARIVARAVLGERANGFHLVSNAIDPARFAGIEHIGTSGPTVTFIGRHERRKGLATLLAAAAAIDADLRLWIIGEGPETERLRREYAHDRRLEWLGRLDDRSVVEHLCASDLFIAPSLGGESFGVVLLEAMAARTAVICSDLPGYRLAADGAARFVPPGDAGQLAAALRELLFDPRRREELVRHGLARANECTFAHQVDDYVALFHAVGAAPEGRYTR